MKKYLFLKKLPKRDTQIGKSNIFEDFLSPTLKGVCTIPSGKELDISTLGYPFGGSKYDSDKKKHAECAFLELS